MLATQVVSAVRKEFGSAVSLPRFFEMPTLAGLAVAVVESQAEEVGEAETRRLLDELENESRAAQALSSIRRGPDHLGPP